MGRGQRPFQRCLALEAALYGLAGVHMAGGCHRLGDEQASRHRTPLSLVRSDLCPSFWRRR
ncbi:lipoprotein [Lysobacter enzymogenes]|uniref:Lipoprotein n=1 Tax=Lysobacter enzymogenes TaxID=69 RepID=A0A0S2DFJ6_LYSEN|nr:lipoprotein [Lysobacter enzymogenes]